MRLKENTLRGRESSERESCLTIMVSELQQNNSLNAYIQYTFSYCITAACKGDNSKYYAPYYFLQCPLLLFAVIMLF